MSEYYLQPTHAPNVVTERKSPNESQDAWKILHHCLIVKKIASGIVTGFGFADLSWQFRRCFVRCQQMLHGMPVLHCA